VKRAFDTAIIESDNEHLDVVQVTERLLAEQADFNGK